MFPEFSYIPVCTLPSEALCAHERIRMPDGTDAVVMCEAGYWLAYSGLVSVDDGGNEHVRYGPHDNLRGSCATRQGRPTLSVVGDGKPLAFLDAEE